MPVGAYSWLFVHYNEVVIDEMFSVVCCPWMTGETKLFHSSLNGVCCRRGVMFLLLPDLLGRCRWFADSWPLLLPPASLLPVWSLPVFCWWSSASFSAGGGLPSFKLMISSYSFMRWMWDVRSRNKCSFSSFNITIILMYSSNNSDNIPFFSFSLLTVSCSTALAQSKFAAQTPPSILVSVWAAHMTVGSTVTVVA